jgi:hypothetical protein
LASCDFLRASSCCSPRTISIFSWSFDTLSGAVASM